MAAFAATFRSTPAQRRWALWILLSMVSAYLALWGDKTPNLPEASEAVRSPLRVTPPQVASRGAPPESGVGPAAVAPAALRTALLPRDILIPARSRDQSGVDLFSARSWTPPPSAKTDGEAAPLLPSFPYAYVGKKLENGVWEVYLSRGNLSFVVRLGDTLEDLYEIEQIAPPVLTVRYRPLGQRQTLVIGEFAE